MRVGKRPPACGGRVFRLFPGGGGAILGKAASPMAYRSDWKDLKTAIGFDPESGSNLFDERRMAEYLNIKLFSRGFPIFGKAEDSPFLEIGKSLLQSVQEKNRLLKDYLCPADQRIQSYLADLFEPLGLPPRAWVPRDALVVERHGMARALSLPPDRDRFESEIVSSYRVKQGVLHNPKSDRRTTRGVFHVAEGGLPVPADKKETPLLAFARLLERALDPPPELLELPFTSTQRPDRRARLFVSLLLRPLVCPRVEGVTEERRSEIRFFAPGSLVSNLDFVESIFGNAGDPILAENDAALDVGSWTGHTGYVLLAPHLVGVRKKDLGLPRAKDATERQRRDGMCWESEEELYNDGGAFKVTSRDRRGVMATLIADNYYGYCKKEVKTQISFAANLLGDVEEEHAGGALTFASYDLGEDFQLSEYISEVDHTFEEMLELRGERVDAHPDGYATDKLYPNIYFLPEQARITLHDQTIAWEKDGERKTLPLRPYVDYILPSGYKVSMVHPMEGRRWRLVGVSASGLFCHKPCTVSGGGKSEISKSIADAIVAGPIFTADIKKDFDLIEEIVNREYGGRFKDPKRNRPKGRPLLSSERSLGSVVKLLSPSPEYTDEYNEWLSTIPGYIVDLALVVKRFYKPDWGDNWRERFSVDIVNGKPGNELKYRDQKLVSQYLRVGFAEDGSWRVFSLRKDFHPAVKIQTEDDISASVTAPASQVEGLGPDFAAARSVKFVANCEYRLFQRPDEAIHRGYDKKTEGDFSKSALFFSNYEPIDRDAARAIEADAIRFGNFTEPMRRTIADFNRADRPDYVVSSAHPRIVDGVPTKNPRYLQNRLDMEDERGLYIANLGARLLRRLPEGKTPPFPVGAILAGRRNNPPEGRVRALAVYNPIHYQELPELFMDFVASLTGKSPSTTGAGSEGALTKGPFNALLPVVDLNNALVSYLATGCECFTTSAGHIGPKCRVDHDISLLAPEIWCRMRPEERQAAYLIENGFLERVEDFERDGKLVQASRLGYRITREFAQAFGGRLFGSPQSVFPEEMLKPELQDEQVFVDGVANIVETQQEVARLYFEDGSVEDACPPLKALLHIMARGQYESKTAKDPEIRQLFTYEAMARSDWYQERLDKKLEIDRSRWERARNYLDRFEKEPLNRELTQTLNTKRLRRTIEESAAWLGGDAARQAAFGRLGADPSPHR